MGQHRPVLGLPFPTPMARLAPTRRVLPSVLPTGPARDAAEAVRFIQTPAHTRAKTPRHGVGGETPVKPGRAYANHKWRSRIGHPRQDEGRSENKYQS